MYSVDVVSGGLFHVLVPSHCFRSLWSVIVHVVGAVYPQLNFWSFSSVFCPISESGFSCNSFLIFSLYGIRFVSSAWHFATKWISSSGSSWHRRHCC